MSTNPKNLSLANIGTDNSANRLARRLEGNTGNTLEGKHKTARVMCKESTHATSFRYFTIVTDELKYCWTGNSECNFIVVER
jgi:hypothetical protein